MTDKTTALPAVDELAAQTAVVSSYMAQLQAMYLDAQTAAEILRRRLAVAQARVAELEAAAKPAEVPDEASAG